MTNLEKSLGECDELYFAGDYEGLIRKCEEILEEHPDYQNAMGYKGIAHCFLKEYDEALEILNRGVELYPNNYYFKNNLSMVYYDLGDYEKSLECCEEGLKIKDFDWLCENKLKALIKLDRMEEAIEFDRTDNSGISLGEVFLEEERFCDALRYYYGHLKDNPDDFYTIEMIKGIICRHDLKVTPEVGDYYLKWIDDIRKVNVSRTCPDCGGKLIPIAWGYPSPETLERAQRGEVHLGGCDVTFKRFNFHCRECKKYFEMYYENFDVESADPKMERYFHFKMFVLLAAFKNGSTNSLEQDYLREYLKTFSEVEFNAFMDKLAEIGFVELKDGYVMLAGF